MHLISYFPDKTPQFQKPPPVVSHHQMPVFPGNEQVLNFSMNKPDVTQLPDSKPEVNSDDVIGEVVTVAPELIRIKIEREEEDECNAAADLFKWHEKIRVRATTGNLFTKWCLVFKIVSISVSISSQKCCVIRCTHPWFLKNKWLQDKKKITFYSCFQEVLEATGMAETTGAYAAQLGRVLIWGCHFLITTLSNSVKWTCFGYQIG